MSDSYSLLHYVGTELIGKTAGVLKNATLNDFFALVDLLDGTQRIFVAGAGRSGLVGRFFAMRMMHLGDTVHIVGETTTPAVGAGDLLVAISGSGKTPTIVHVAQLAKAAGAHVACLCLKSSANSPLAELSDLVVKLDRRTNDHMRLVYPVSDSSDLRQNLTPMGTVFELATLIYLESVAAELIRRRKVLEQDMKLRHANLE